MSSKALIAFCVVSALMLFIGIVAMIVGISTMVCHSMLADSQSVQTAR